MCIQIVVNCKMQGLKVLPNPGVACVALEVQLHLPVAQRELRGEGQVLFKVSRRYAISQR